MLFVAAHIRWPSCHRANQISNEIKPRRCAQILRTRRYQAPADDFRFRKQKVLRLGFQFLGQVVWNPQNQSLHDPLVLHEPRMSNTKEENIARQALNGSPPATACQHPPRLRPTSYSIAASAASASLRAFG